MKVTDNFKKSIKAYLDEKAKTDKLFAVSYAKEKKNIDECCNFILQQVQKSGCNGFEDDEIFGMAVHYYDEDSIKDIKAVNAKVVVNHVVKLTEEEKKAAHEDAVKKYEATELKKIEDSRKRRLEKKAEKAAKQDVQPSLFEF